MSPSSLNLGKGCHEWAGEILVPSLSTQPYLIFKLLFLNKNCNYIKII